MKSKRVAHICGNQVKYGFKTITKRNRSVFRQWYFQVFNNPWHARLAKEHYETTGEVL